MKHRLFNVCKEKLFTSILPLPFPHISRRKLIVMLQGPTTKGNLIAVTNQDKFENLRFVVDKIIHQKNWQDLDGETKLWWTGLEGQAPS